MQRRVFVRSGALALVTMGLSPSFLRRSVFGLQLPSAGKGKVLVCLFQRGAADALNMVVPHGEAAYYSLRPSIAVPRPRQGNDQAAIDLDGFFGLHPALGPLHRWYREGILAPVQAVGSPSATRSHFDAQDYMESGTPDRKGTPDGWLNRYLAVSGTCEECADVTAPTPFRAVSMTSQTPRILGGPEPALAMASLGDFTIRASSGSAARLEAIYKTGSADLVHASGREMFEALRMLRSANPQRYSPDNGAQYPRSQFGQRLREIAQLIKSDLGLEVAFADVGGWDTHVNQGGATGQLAVRLRDFGESVDAFVTDMGTRMSDVLVMTMTEFGRMARQNGNGGTDHGHAGAMFLVGGSVKGGRVHGKWPGLEREQLHEGRDLALTTDFRSVFAEVLERHLGAQSPTSVFPGFNGTGDVGVL
ncbi:MAG: DUF1501 domain-containing protein [Gemmatimonadota bacterium]